jgi:hypothetical protein
MAKKKRYKVSLESETLAISLVENPAMDSEFVALEKEEEEKENVFLSSDEKHMVYGAVLIPDKDVYRKANGGYYINFSKESIEKMSQDIMKEYRQFDIKTDHKDEVSDVCVVESWIVQDSYKDKSNALGIDVPEGTWMAGVKVNNQDTWNRIKNGELKGFSVESVLAYSEVEEFEKQNENNMNIETNDEMFWSKLKNVITELFSKQTEETVNLEAETPTETPTVVEEPKVEEPAVEQPKVEDAAKATQNPTDSEPKVEEPKVEEPKVEEPKTEEPKETVDVKHLEELINSMKSEIAALKELNGGLKTKVKELEKQPSVAPVNTNAKPNANDTYSAWREQMAKYL